MNDAVYGINPFDSHVSQSKSNEITKITQTEKPKLLPVRPLTPISNSSSPTKALSSPRSPSTVVSSSKPGVSRACKVPGCPRSPCNLISHQRYEPQRPSLKRKRGQSKESNQQIVPLNSDRADHQIYRDGVDGLPHLPVPEGLDPEFRALFHFFFDSVFDRLTLIFRPPPVPPIFKSRMLAVALTNRAYCMCLIAHSRIDMSISRQQFTENRQSLTLYSKLIGVYREELGAMSGLQIDMILLALSVLITYDLIHGRHRSAEIHWGGMRQIVDSRGGIHNLGLSLAYVIHLDRMCANFLRKPPMYPLPGDRSIQLTRPPRVKYGSKFTHYRTTHPSPLTLETLDYCEDSCRLLEVFEASHKTFHVSKAQPRPDAAVEYVYYSRDRLDGSFAVIQPTLEHIPKVDAVVLLAARTGEYCITWANYIPTYTILCCNRLLEHLDPPSWPREHTDLLIWALFMPLMMGPAAWTGRARVLEYLYEELHRKYIDDTDDQPTTLPTDEQTSTQSPTPDHHSTTSPVKDSQPSRLPELWKWNEWQACREFVWSDVHCLSHYNTVCEEIDTLEREKLNIPHDNDLYYSGAFEKYYENSTDQPRVMEVD